MTLQYSLSPRTGPQFADPNFSQADFSKSMQIPENKCRKTAKAQNIAKGYRKLQKEPVFAVTEAFNNSRIPKEYVLEAILPS